MRIFQTFLLPHDLVAKYKLSSAAANFSRNLMQGGGFDKVYSLMPLTVKGEMPPIINKGYEVVYSNWRKRGSILAKLAIFHKHWMLLSYKVKAFYHIPFFLHCHFWYLSLNQ